MSNLATATNEVNRLSLVVEFLNKIALGDGYATLGGVTRPTLDTLASSFLQGMNVYEDLSSGLAESGEGGFFSILSDVTGESVVLYQKVNGQAVERRRFPSTEVVQMLLDAAQQIETNTAIAQTARDQSVVASEASGDVRFFDTKADADAATLAEGDVVEVFADESRSGEVARYRYASGSLVFKYPPGQGIVYAGGQSKTQQEWAEQILNKLDPDGDVSGTQVTTVSGMQPLPSALNQRVIQATTFDELRSLTFGLNLPEGMQASVKGSGFRWSSERDRWVADGPIRPESFGAKGDGSADDSASIAALNDFLSDDDHVYLSGRYRMRSAVEITSRASWEWGPNAEIVNDVDTDQPAPSAGESNRIKCLVWTGTGVHYSGDLPLNAYAGNSTITLPTGHGVEEGDLVRFSSDAILSDTRDAVVTRAEYVRVMEVSGDNITVDPPLYDSYLTADSGKVEARKPIRGLRLIGPKIGNTQGYLLEGIEIRYFDDLVVEKARCYGGEKGILATDGIDCQFIDCAAWGVNEDLGYALHMRHVTNAIFVRPRGSGNRHTVELSGTCKNTLVEDAVCGPDREASVSWHPGPEYNELRGGKFVPGAGVTMRGQFNKLIGPKFMDTARVNIGEAAASGTITRAVAGEDLQIIGCEFVGRGGSGLEGGKVQCLHPVVDAVIRDNIIRLSGSGNELQAFRFLAGGRNIALDNNKIDNTIPLVIGLVDAYSITNIEAARTTLRDIYITRMRGTTAGPLVLKTGVDVVDLWIDNITFDDNEIERLSGSSQIIAFSDALQITNLTYRRNKTKGGFSSLANQQSEVAPSWGLIVSGGNEGDIADSDVYTTNSSGQVEMPIPDGLRSVSPGAGPAFVCEPIFSDTSGAGWQAKIDRYNYSAAGALQSVRYRLYNGDGASLGSGLSAVITRIR